MRKQFLVRAELAAKHAQVLSRRHIVILLGLASIAIAMIYVHDWPRQTADGNPIPLDGTGVSRDVAALLNSRGKYSAPVPRPAITPQTADEFAGVLKDPIQQYGVQLPRSNAKP